MVLLTENQIHPHIPGNAIITEGDICVTVSCHKTVRGYGYYGTTLYIAVKNTKGKLVWRKYEMLNDTTAGMSGRVRQRAINYACENNLPYFAKVRHNQPVIN